MIPLDKTILLEVAPRFTGIRGQRQAKIVAELGSVLSSTLEAYAINNRLRIAHFLG